MSTSDCVMYVWIWYIYMPEFGLECLKCEVGWAGSMWHSDLPVGCRTVGQGDQCLSFKTWAILLVFWKR